MINELNILILLGLTLILIVPVVMLRQQIKHGHPLNHYNNIDKYTNAENQRSSYFEKPSTIEPVNANTVLRKNHQEQDQENKISTVREIFATEKSDLFQSIFESSPECIVLQKPDGIIELINNTGLNLLETDESSNVIGQQIYGLIAQEFHQAYREMVDQVFLGDRVSLEYEMCTFKGKRRWMKTNAVPLRNSRNEVIKLIAITHDITENKQMSQQLEAHRKKLQTIIESEPECVKLQDSSGKITEMNPAGLALLNAVKHDDVIGKTIYDFLMPEYVNDYRELTARVFNGGRGSMEFEVVSLKGRRRWLETHAAPLIDSSGNVSALLAITRDIDGRKKNEARLCQQQTELARVCRLSTMGEMASSLAHELNQPLCAVSSYAESARLLNLSSSRKLDELLDKIVLQSKRATQIIKNTRDFVRKQTPTPEPISAASIINSVIDFVELDRRREMVNINLQIADDLAPVKADRVQIEQVLINLISNAIQAMSVLAHDQRVISIKVLKESSEELLFKICNTGPDISADVVKELFTPFYTTKETGLGMGLSISRSIVEAHSGRLWYKTKPGHGACFYFTLPTIDHA